VKAIAEYLTQRSAGVNPATKRTVSRKRSTRAKAPGYFDGLPRVAPERTGNVQLNPDWADPYRKRGPLDGFASEVKRSLEAWL